MDSLDVNEARKNCSAKGRTLPLLTDERGVTMAKWISGEDLLQGDTSKQQKPSLGLAQIVPAAGGLLLWLPTVLAG